MRELLRMARTPDSILRDALTARARGPAPEQRGRETRSVRRRPLLLALVGVSR
ncbi:hypothetical protein ACFCYB_35260 [Streptomyces sp. NPDC056309]|uniref:hypothetical protein n=1 Tax=unclassified Streptomyces TaxID=2593676 RepID=UPI0035DEC527